MSDTTDLAEKMARANAMVLEQQANAAREAQETAEIERLAGRRNVFWIVACACASIAATLTVLDWTLVFRAPHGMLLWLTAVLTTCSILGGIATQVAIYHRKTARRLCQAKAEIREEIRDARPADAIELGRITSMLERAEHDRTAILRRINEVEQQRESDLIQGRDALRKRFEEMSDRLDVIEEHLRGSRDPATGFSQYLAARDDLRREQDDNS